MERWYDDPALREVWTEDEGDYLEQLRERNDALFSYIHSLPPLPATDTDALLAEAVAIDRQALEAWIESRDAADPYNVLVEE